MTIPRATYRLQFHRGFTFNDARAILPYLSALGVSHVYASPFLKARAGSLHGYDIVDHEAINPEIGTPEAFSAFTDALKQHQLGLMIDIVPNHMGVLESDNRWWLDVLENGLSSRYAEYFDIEWHPESDELQGKVLVPVLGDHYGTILEQGDLQVAFAPETGEFSLHYFKHHFPLDPREYALVANPLRAREAGCTELATLLAAFSTLPVAGSEDSTGRSARAARAAQLKQQLAALCARDSDTSAWIARAVVQLNGNPQDPASFDGLHALIKAQSFRLAHWRVAGDDINYRRFFDVNDLAALRTEHDDVFAATHRLVLQWVADGRVDALRVDHPDGLHDPLAYFTRLQQATPPARGSGDDDARWRGLPVYLVIEKILAEGERLDPAWPVHGTTGYEFAVLVNALFVDSSAHARMQRTYQSFIGEPLRFDPVLHAAKHAVMQNALSGDLNALASRLTRIAKADRHTCDFTLNSVRQALADIVAGFPVYRTYIGPAGPNQADQRVIATAAAAASRDRVGDRSVVDFVVDMLTQPAASRGARAPAVARFISRFQQFCAPVMAKGMEDTSFYVYNRLTSLNDVGGDPRVFGVSVDAFHRAMVTRARDWPHAMLAASTHDSKRSEDVRARIDVIAEMPAAWRLALARWRRLNQQHKTTLNGALVPSANDEYLLYQTLLGVWPDGTVDATALAALAGRVRAYMQKAVREAKVQSSWLNPDAAYEAALDAFIDAILDADGAFVSDFAPAQRRIARFGFHVSLAQSLLRLTVPGVPDIYQGAELPEYRLVDPDNRRPVDYVHRQALLAELAHTFATDGPGTAAAAAALLTGTNDDRARLYVAWRALGLRARDAALFRDGSYVPLRVTGRAASHVCAFARVLEGRTAVVVVPRLLFRMVRDEAALPVTGDAWGDTRVRLPAQASAQVGAQVGALVDVLTARAHARNGTLALADVLRDFPVALLYSAN